LDAPCETLDELDGLGVPDGLELAG
jgi:hypothetical protein